MEGHKLVEPWGLKNINMHTLSLRPESMSLVGVMNLLPLGNEQDINKKEIRSCVHKRRYLQWQYVLYYILVARGHSQGL